MLALRNRGGGPTVCIALGYRLLTVTQPQFNNKDMHSLPTLSTILYYRTMLKLLIKGYTMCTCTYCICTHTFMYMYIMN